MVQKYQLTDQILDNELVVFKKYQLYFLKLIINNFLANEPIELVLLVYQSPERNPIILTGNGQLILANPSYGLDLSRVTASFREFHF